MGHIFISYSHKDTTYAHGLADHLRNMGFDIWMDERLDYGSQWPLEIQKQLDACAAFIILMTPRAFASEWVQSELQRAKRKLKPIFPLLLEGDEPWLSVESTQYYDVRKGDFPDARFYSALERVVGGADLKIDSLPKAPDKPKKKRERRNGSRSTTSLPAISIKGENVIGIINASGSARVKVNQKVVHQVTPQMEKVFKRAHKQIKTRPEDSNVDKQKLENQVRTIEVEAAKGDKADQTKLEQWLKTLEKMAPDIVEVMAASLGGPIAGFTIVFKKILERARVTPVGAER